MHFALSLSFEIMLLRHRINTDRQSIWQKDIVDILILNPESKNMCL